jgi:hypothetical protein
MQEGDFQAVISTLNVVDHDGDLTLPGAFGEQQVIISSYGHASWGGGFNGLPVGKGRIFEAGNEAIAEGRFFLDTRGGQETYRAVKNIGDLQEWSYALPEIDYEMREQDGKRVRVLKRIRVNEVSPCLMGAGIRTRTLAIKGAGGEVKLFSGPVILGGEEGPAALFRQFKNIMVGYDRNRERWNSAMMAELEWERERFERISKAAKPLLASLGHFYTIIDSSAVPAENLRAAQLALELCQRKGIVVWPLTIAWFVPESRRDREYVQYGGDRDWPHFEMDSPVSGKASTYSDTIYIGARFTPWQTAYVVAHEAKHITQPTGMSDEEMERDACAFGEEVANELQAALA